MVQYQVDEYDEYNDELLFFFILLSIIRGAKYKRDSLLFFFLVLIMISY